MHKLGTDTNESCIILPSASKLTDLKVQGSVEDVQEKYDRWKSVSGKYSSCWWNDIIQNKI